MIVSEVLETVTRIVSPVLGETMARSAAKAHCDKLGLDGAKMTPDQVAALIERIGKGLNIFVGRDRAQLVVAELRRALTGSREAAS